MFEFKVTASHTISVHKTNKPINSFEVQNAAIALEKSASSFCFNSRATPLRSTYTIYAYGRQY